jgi:hypothetical protein
MKIVLDVELNREPKENDLIVFKGGKWQVITKKEFLASQEKINLNVDKKLKDLEENLVKLAKIVKEK